MKAIVADSFGSFENLHMEEIPTPIPADNEVQIEVHYASVNPVDWKILEGLFEGRLPHKFPLIPGWDAAGVVTKLGAQVKKFKIGDAVFAYCRKPVIQWGTYAEYVCVDASFCAKMPANSTFAQAAAVPLVALTAWQGLFDFAKLKKGENILIHAGAGGVGSFAVAFAKNAGAKVFTTASRENHSYVKELGADVAIDYKRQDFVTEVKRVVPEGVDVIFDTIGGDTLRKSIQVLKPHGRLIGIVSSLDPALAKKHEIQFSYVFVTPNGNELQQIADLIESKKIKGPHIKEMPLEEAAKAQEINQQGHTKGKIVLKVKK